MRDNPEFSVYTDPRKSVSEFETFLSSLPEKDRIKLLQIIRNIEEHGMLIAMRQEWVKRLDDEIFEIRSKVATNIQRALYFQKVDQNYIITHGFTKKTQKTPPNEIKYAHAIMKKYLEEQKNAD